MDQEMDMNQEGAEEAAPMMPEEGMGEEAAPADDQAGDQAAA